LDDKSEHGHLLPKLKQLPTPPTNHPTTPSSHPPKIVFACELVLPGTNTTKLLTDNLCNYLIPGTLLFTEKTNCDLLLNHKRVGDMTGFDNSILMAYGMCPPCKLQEYHQLPPDLVPTHFIRGTADEVWGDDTHKVMRTTADDWTDCVIYSGKIPFLCSLFVLFV
jgi:hypothetical protein